jgi:hypothetical protein
MQSGQGQWFALALRREFSAEAVSELSDQRPCVSSLSVIDHGGGALVACFDLQRVAALVVAHRWCRRRGLRRLLWFFSQVVVLWRLVVCVVRVRCCVWWC